MATYRTSHPGNLAIQTEVWTLTIDEARNAQGYFNCNTGSYWYENLTKPLNRAVRKKAKTVTIYTAGFSSGEFSNALYATGSTIEN